LDDYYQADSIKLWLEIPTFSVPSWCLKLFPTMGDRVAVAVLKAIYPANNVEDVKLRKILAAISASFEYLDMIGNHSDRVPAITLCLLELLFARAGSSGQREKIRSVASEVKTRTEFGDGKLPF
jgi:hypothetical protein